MEQKNDSSSRVFDISRLRKDYGKARLTRADLTSNPIEQFQLWFHQAIAAHLPEPNAMSLATANATGRTTLRTVLLKAYDQHGFVFYTNLESTKAKQIEENPHASLLFPWLKLERQVIVNGRAEKLSTRQVLRYFLTRPKGSRLAAWISPQSRTITSRQVLEMKLEEIKQKFSRGEIPLPSFWGGFRVVPGTIEFWQGGANRLHDRFLYTKTAPHQWRIERLAP